MKHFLAPLTLPLSFLIVGCGGQTQNGSPDIIESHLVQKPPGSTPEIFLSGIVNTEENREVEGMFSPDMQTFYFIRRPLGEDSNSNQLIALEHKDNEWQEKLIKESVSEPSISPDGNIIYLKKKYIERTPDGWSELKSLGEPFEDIDIMRLSAASSGTYYFDTFSPDLDMPLRYSRQVEGMYEQPKSLGRQFADGEYNAHPFIAPDESYIIWDSIRESGYGASDLYVSFREADDSSWGPAINLGSEINTAHAENYPSLSPDGKYLFFDRRVKTDGIQDVDIFWVDTQYIETLRP